MQDALVIDVSTWPDARFKNNVIDMVTKFSWRTQSMQTRLDDNKRQVHRTACNLGKKLHGKSSLYD